MQFNLTEVPLEMCFKVTKTLPPSNRCLDFVQITSPAQDCCTHIWDNLILTFCTMGESGDMSIILQNLYVSYKISKPQSQIFVKKKKKIWIKKGNTLLSWLTPVYNKSLRLLKELSCGLCAETKLLSTPLSLAPPNVRGSTVTHCCFVDLWCVVAW